MTDTTIDEAQIAADAQADYDLLNDLTNRKLREGGIRVFTDEPLGVQHLEVLDRIDALKKAARDELRDPETGVVLIEAIAIDKRALNKLEKEKRALEEKLAATSIDFSWRALHAEGVKHCRTEANKSVGLPFGAAVPEELKESWNDWYLAHLLSRAVTGYVMHREGAEDVTRPGISLSAAHRLKGLLPPSEHMRLDMAYARDQFSQAIASEAIDPDFSRSI